MKLRLLSTILTILILITRIPGHLCQNDRQYETCRQGFVCGSQRELGYPFYGADRPASCGYPGFELDCRGDNPLLEISSTPYRVLDINNETQTLRIARNDLWDTLCPRILVQTTLNFTIFSFDSSSNDQNISLYYGCDQVPTGIPNPFRCDVNGNNTWSFYWSLTDLDGWNSCGRSITVPVNATAAQLLRVPTSSTFLLQSALTSGFSVLYKAENDNCRDCVTSGGVCGFNQNRSSFACYCADRAYDSTCDNDRAGGNGTHHPFFSVVTLVDQFTYKFNIRERGSFNMDYI